MTDTPMVKKQVNSSSGSSSYYTLGCNYMDGVHGVEKDYVKAFELFSKGADEGCLESIHKIGYLYDEGLGVERDYSKAMEWYLKSAEGGLVYSQFNIAVLYEDGTGVEKDDVKAFEWYLKAAENGSVDAQFNVGNSYRRGVGVEQDYSKAFEWYLKAAENRYKLAQYNVGCCYESGDGTEKDMKKALYLQAKGLNEIDFKFIEPYHEFGIEQFKNSDSENDLKQTSNENEITSTEQVIIRFEEKDFKVSNTFLNSKYLSTMLNSNWRDLNQKHEGEIVLDLRSIQNEIFQEETNHIQIFELYFNYLTKNELPNDCDLKLKLIELSRYLGDDECILQIMRESSILMRFYILFKFELIEPIHIAIASCSATESSKSSPLNIDDLPENELEVLLIESELSSQAKKVILKRFEKKFKKFPPSIIFSKLINMQVDHKLFQITSYFI